MKILLKVKLGLKAALIILTMLIIQISCGYSSSKMKPDSYSKNESDNFKNSVMNDSLKNQSDKYFKLDKLIIILASELDENSSNINVQDFIENGKSFIPVFSSEEKFNESTNGVDLGKQKIEINPYLLLSILKGNETLRINPTLSDEVYFNASDLKQLYKSEIETLLNKINK